MQLSSVYVFSFSRGFFFACFCALIGFSTQAGRLLCVTSAVPVPRPGSREQHDHIHVGVMAAPPDAESLESRISE